MSFTLFVVTLLVLLTILAHWSNVRLYATTHNLHTDTPIYDNTHVPLLDPPKEIIINENNVSCHKTPTPCISNADCQLCLEGLASCQLFNDTVILEIDDNQQMIVEPGQKLCLAIDNRSARSCNPNTGTWMLRQVDNINMALICHCDTPGLVTQLNIYDDCSFPVGCKPHGIIADINSSPLTCLCENGFVSELSDTNTPYCRPQVMRDVMLDPNFFHRPPCRDGFLPAEHPAFDQVYRRQIGANVCLPDPCSVDPLTGVRHEGRVVYEVEGGADGGELVMCRCNINDNLYPVYSVASMLNTVYTEFDREIANACVKPLIVGRRDVRSDLKVFWGRDSLKSDADIVFQVDEHHVYEPYRVLLYRRITHHPTLDLTTSFILKFQLHTAYTVSAMDSNQRDVFQGYWQLNHARTSNNTCPLPGIGECRNPQTCGNITCTYNPCIGNSVVLGYYSRCFFFKANRRFDNVGTIAQVCVWNAPTYYNSDNVPVTFYLNALGATDGGYGISNDVRTLYFTNSGATVPQSQFNTLIQLLATYPYYNS
uniref:ORF75 pif-2 n=1 Tax=Cydia pomonella granulosis virus TaxID=28289 RepID=A0A097P145_GVCP|nr:ORF75 pif-2 [Cydia pomonella granulovirus]